MLSLVLCFFILLSPLSKRDIYRDDIGTAFYTKMDKPLFLHSGLENVCGAKPNQNQTNDLH